MSPRKPITGTQTLPAWVITRSPAGAPASGGDALKRAAVFMIKQAQARR